MASETEQKVVSIVAQLRRIPPDTVSPESSLEQLGFDSLDRVNLLFELESAFDLEIPESEAKAIKTVADIVSRLEAIRGGQSRTSGAV